ncbi:MAG: aldo/keto reductase [Elusimicrobiota bacterium]
MQYANLGKTGLVVSRLSFGAMTFGQGEMVPGVKSDVDQQHADRMVGTAIDGGVNLFDTADLYHRGESESMLGKALRGKRENVII